MKTRIAAIYSVWDSEELLPYSVKSIENHVDLIIFVYQTTSNFGEKHNPLDVILDIIPTLPCKAITECYTPKIFGGMHNETAKRNIGLKIAKACNCTHFLHIDCDEMYQDFGSAKKQYLDSGAWSSVCQMWTFFKEPTLRLKNPENYFVPFITLLEDDTIVGNYHYAFYCDPTRKPFNPNTNRDSSNWEVLRITEFMQHFSYVRKDIERKIRNSSASANLAKSNILEDYNSPDVGEGFYVRFFEQKLIRTENHFGIEI